MTRELRVALVLFAAVLALGIGLEMRGTPAIDPWLSRIAAEGRTQSAFWIVLSTIGKGQVVGAIARLAAGRVGR